MFFSYKENDQETKDWSFFFVFFTHRFQFNLLREIIKGRLLIYNNNNVHNEVKDFFSGGGGYLTT